MATKAEFLKRQYNHIVLPVNVPGAEDGDIVRVERALLDRMHHAIGEFLPFVPQAHQESITAVKTAMWTCRTLHVEGTIDKNALLIELPGVLNGTMLILHVKQQNAAVLIYAQACDTATHEVIFESFETSAASNSVLAAEGPLRWQFPGQAVAIPYDVFVKKSFQEEVASFLERASVEFVSQFAAVTYKAYAPLLEVRDTTDPALITALFMTILGSIGRVHRPVLLEKRVRDTVCFEQAYKPWRRAPFYLCLRVAMQRHLYRLLGDNVGMMYYKIILCLFMVRFLEGSHGCVPDEASHFLKTKLGLRLSKLQSKAAKGPQQIQELLESLSPLLEKLDAALSETSCRLDKKWKDFKTNTTRYIWRLHQSPRPGDLSLQLPRSLPRLKKILSHRLFSQRAENIPPLELIGRFEESHAKKPFTLFVKNFLEPWHFEEKVVVHATRSNERPFDDGRRCEELAATIQEYVLLAGEVLDSFSELKSLFLLNLMELWIEMDKSAVACYGLLNEYHPPFGKGILDSVQLLSESEMKRAQAVQEYLEIRNSNPRGNGASTIFDPPSATSFAVRYFDKSASHSQLRHEIEKLAEEERETKLEEYNAMKAKYDGLMKEVASRECLKYTKVLQSGLELDNQHSPECFTPRGKHFYLRKAEKMSIQIFEHPLPASEPSAKAVVFELRCPEAFAAYRDATWLILGTFAQPRTVSNARVTTVGSYVRLKVHMNEDAKHKVTLGSWKKSHLEAHWARVAITARLKDVFRDCPLEFSYYDSDSNTWASLTQISSFSQHFSLHLPRDSPYHCLEPNLENWPSSNEILANHTICPVDINRSEFESWQNVLVGTYARWPRLLGELGSRTLNFSTDSTWTVVSRMLLEIGPASTSDPLRDIHGIFVQEDFCLKLMAQVSHRLETIRHNWKEPVQMDLLITILLRVFHLSPNSGICNQAIELLQIARSITGGWCADIRIHTIDHSSNATSSLAIWASLLCKRTFYVFSKFLSHLDTESLACFIEASVTLQDNLMGRPEDLPHNLRNAFVNDWHFSYSSRSEIRDTILQNSRAFIIALQVLWPTPPDYQLDPRSLARVGHSDWLELSIKDGSHTPLRQVHYNCVDGSLLVDGEPLGILPSEFRTDPFVRSLFGDQIPRVRPSNMQGMSVVVDRQMPCGTQLHFGRRDSGELVVRAAQRGTTLEYIFSCTFCDSTGSDLPAPLIQGCHHWLNIDSGVLQIRQGEIWKARPSNWLVDVNRRQGFRFRNRRKERLVEPASRLSQAVRSNFRFFEHPEHIVVSYIPGGNTYVELKLLGLLFFVNGDGWLQSNELSAQITPFQDIGTWHGLRSMIVIQSTFNPRQQSVLVPMGESVCWRQDENVSVKIKNSRNYLRFGVNNVLGRLDCPTEPRMLYTRAKLHAYTAHFLPDRLTGRTGAEEALAYLESGMYQPYQPLDEKDLSLVLDIAKLTPRRRYYPEHLKNMEAVEWQSSLTTVMQDDRYRSRVHAICERSTGVGLEARDLCPPGNPHLETRASGRTYASYSQHLVNYDQRDLHLDHDGLSNVSEVCCLLHQWLPTAVNVSGMKSQLQSLPIIGGYTRRFDLIQLSDILTVDLGAEWGAISKTALESSVDDRYRLIFILGPMAFRGDAPMELIRFLVSMAVVPAVRDIQQPPGSSYSGFIWNHAPSPGELSDLMQSAKLPFVPEGPIERGKLHLTRKQHDDRAQKACLTLAASILSQWPADQIDYDRLVKVDDVLLDKAKALLPIEEIWTRLTGNFKLTRHLQEVQFAINGYVKEICLHQTCLRKYSIAFTARSHYASHQHGSRVPLLSDLLANPITVAMSSQFNTSNGVTDDEAVVLNSTCRSSARIETTAKEPGINSKRASNDHSRTMRELRTIVQPFQVAGSGVQRRYGSELCDSIRAYAAYVSNRRSTATSFAIQKLPYNIRQSGTSLDHQLFRIKQALEASDARARWLRHAGLWPRITMVTLLTELRSTAATSFGRGTREALVDLALCVTEHQRLLRIEDALMKRKEQQVAEELANIGHQNWDPLKYTDWLLLEADGNISIRPDQVDVALATIAPRSGENAVLQLLMGKGKTSCILPMAACVLANRRNLFRIIVPRALLLQSAQVMQSKLGALLDRQFIHVPFSRKTKLDKTLLETYFNLHRRIRATGGIVLALPEHIMSFKLSGIQRLCDGKKEEALMMVNVQTWFDKHTRDVLDECDVSLAVRTQLIYPSGSQMAVDGHPMRWQTIQAVLREVESLLPDLRLRFPRGIETVPRPNGGFPLIYFLHKDAEEEVIARLVRVICYGKTSILPTLEIPASYRDDIQAYISNTTVEVDVVKRVNLFLRDRQHLMKTIYLLRGLLVNRILLSTLRKRWNVQYGLHPKRDPIAVPYIAKGVPSDTAEWGHPDVAIILTCLSFYYNGIGIGQLKQAFEQLLKADEPSVEYEKWHTANLQESLRDFNSINVENEPQLRELHRFFSHNQHLLEFFLNTLVFPKHAKQFESKLQASGWDLVLFDPYSKSKCRTSGFSGTNDTRHQLPLTIKQQDLPQLAHTNAEVLLYLLEPRNRRYIGGTRLTERELLQTVTGLYGQTWGTSRQRVRVLIDVGAQILEYENESLVTEWLDIDPDAKAAVFFSSDHKPWVKYRRGQCVPLVASLFVENLQDCLVYLDESHCRGTDLKLPFDAQAALTLGPHLTKDALVQAAMRLRLLGSSQSVIFIAPPEVHQSIVDLQKDHHSMTPDSADVIRWLIEQTCNSLEQYEPLYNNQGNDYLQRLQAKIDNPDFLRQNESQHQYLSVMLSKESKTLKQLYEPKNLRRVPKIHYAAFHTALGGFVKELNKRKLDFQDRGIAVHSSALEEVEQEREVEFQVESIREVHKPVHFEPWQFFELHKDIRAFVFDGRLKAFSEAYESVFSTMKKTALGAKRNAIKHTTSGLFVSTQFNRTVKVFESNDSFLRPVQWLLWNRKTDTGIIVQEEEADALIPILRKAREDETQPCTSHLIVYSAPVTRRMLHFNNLNYFAIPNLPDDFRAPIWLKIELGIFSGRLYFGWDEYEPLLGYFGIPTGDDSCPEHQKVFAKKPLTFIHDWLAIRRRGQDFENTPMGFVTTGKPLFKEHPFFLSLTAAETVDAPRPIILGATVQENEDDSDDNAGYEDNDGMEIGHRDDGIEYKQELPLHHDEGVFYDAVEHREDEEEFHEIEE